MYVMKMLKNFFASVTLVLENLVLVVTLAF